MSEASEEDKRAFRSSVVTLTSMLHAACLGHVCSKDFEVFEVLNLAALDRSCYERLKGESLNTRVDLIYMWYSVLIIKNLKEKLLNVPPPILSRVFQETEKAMIEYKQILEVMSIPFPFPYAQTGVFLLVLMGLVTPWAMCTWTNHPASCCLATFIAVLCLTSLELIASQLKNPFGEDTNDLPVEEFQQEINESLRLLLKPYALDCPALNFELSSNDALRQAATAGCAVEPR